MLDNPHDSWHVLYTFQRRKWSAIGSKSQRLSPNKPSQRDTAMRTLIISYDLAKPHRNKHILAQAIMALGQSWARPLEQTWYIRTDASEALIELHLSTLLDPDDGLLIQAVKDDAVLTNAALRWFRQRQAGVEIGPDTNVIAFPVVPPFAPTEQPELPLAAAC
jgi:hypothetical protein